jgi:ribosome biogenesis GTPase A
MGRGAGRLSRHAKHKNILFTGVPGIGKSTIIEKIVQRINRSKTGFYTREMRASGRRVGFTITTLDGEHGTLAHIDIPGRMHPEFFFATAFPDSCTKGQRKGSHLNF